MSNLINNAALALEYDEKAGTAQKATSPQALIESSLRRHDFSIAHRDAKPWPFNYLLAAEQCQSWVYRCVYGNAERAASVPMRLYVRKLSRQQKAARGLTKGCLYETRPVARKRMKYLRGDAEHVPSQRVLQKIAQFGEDFEEVVETHPVLDVLHQANPWMSGFSLASFRFIMLQLTGNAYLHPIMSTSLDRPTELWPMLSQYMWIKPDPVDYIKGYLYGTSRDNLQDFEPEEVLHFRKPNPRDLYYGLGSVEAAWSALGLHNAKRENDKALFDNRSRPDYLLSVEDANPDALDRFDAKTRSLLHGVRNAGGFLTVSGKVSAQPLSFPPDKMGDQQEIVEEIAGLLGYPITKLKANDPNRANAEMGDRGWLQDTILPMIREDEQALNEANGYLGLFAGGALLDDAVICYDNPVPQDREYELRERQAMISMGSLTINEDRAEQGREDLEGGDEPLIDAGKVPLSKAGIEPVSQAFENMPTIAPTADATPAPVEQGREFNGAQVTSAVEVLMGVTDRTLAARTATMLLITMFGIEPTQAQEMVDAQVQARPSGTTVAGDNDADRPRPETDSGVQQTQPPSGGGTASPEQRNHKRKGGNVDAGASGEGSRSTADARPDRDGRRHDASRERVKAIADVDLTPPEGVQEAAQQGLDYRSEYGRGGTDVGIARARDLSNGSAVSPDTIGRMVSFFARHKENRDPDAREPDGGPSNGWIAWLLWGGDPGESWANAKQTELENAAEKAGKLISHKALMFGGKGCTCHSDDSAQTPVGKYLARKVRTKADAEDDVRAGEQEMPLVAMEAAIAAQFVAQAAELRQAIGDATEASLNAIDNVLSDEAMAARWATSTADAVRPSLAAAITDGGTDAIRGIGVEVGFNVTNPAVDEFLEQYTFRLSGEMSNATLDALKQTVRSGLDEGASTRDIASRLLSESIGTEANPGPMFSQSRASMIARTESARAYVEGEKEGWRQSGVVRGVEWLLAPSSCPFCESAAAQFRGKVQPLDEPFFAKGSVLTGTDGSTMKLDYTDVSGPPLHPNCMLPGTPVLARGLVAGYSASYDGPAIEFTFANGRRLSVTANHPLLTPNGFVAAKLLREGSDVISCAGFERVVSGDPDNDHGVSMIEDVVGSLAKSGGVASCGVPVSAEYLHGDGRFCDGDINVVTTDGLLWDAIEASRREHANQLPLCASWSDSRLLGLGDFDSMLVSLSLAAHGLGASFSHGSSLLWRSGCHANVHGSTSPTLLDTGVVEQLDNSATAIAQSLRSCLDRFPSMVAVDKIVDVKVFRYTGHVYDLQTESGLYIGNTVLASNCRCDLLPVTRDIDNEDD